MYREVLEFGQFALCDSNHNEEEQPYYAMAYVVAVLALRGKTCSSSDMYKWLVNMHYAWPQSEFPSDDMMDALLIGDSNATVHVRYRNGFLELYVGNHKSIYQMPLDEPAFLQFFCEECGSESGEVCLTTKTEAQLLCEHFRYMDCGDEDIDDLIRHEASKDNPRIVFRWHEDGKDCILETQN